MGKCERARMWWSTSTAGPRNAQQPMQALDGCPTNKLAPHTLVRSDLANTPAFPALAADSSLAGTRTASGHACTACSMSMYFSITLFTASGVLHTTARSLRARSIFCTRAVTAAGSPDSLDRRSKWKVYTRF
jgi:hypothetical protein